MNETEEIFAIIIAATAVTIALFLALRIVFLWYWKINEIIDNQKRTVLLLTQMLNHQVTGKIYGNLEGDVIVYDSSDDQFKAFTSS